MRTVWARRLSWLAPAALALAALAAGCGGSSSSSSSTAAAQVSPAANTSTTKTKPAKSIHLRIISPKSGAHTGETLTVRVGLTGASSAHARFHYVLGSIKRSAGAKITFHGVAAGRHHLSVTLASNPKVHASVVVTVRPPKPPPVSTQAPVTQAPAPTTTSSSPTPAPTPPPTTTKSAPPPPPPPTTTKTSPPPSGGIPQGNGGDADGDNNGGPSDGDGLI